MLRLLYRNIVFTAHSLKHYTYSRPQEIEWLKNKFYSNPKYVDKLEYLQKLQRQNSLANFFGDKSIDLLTEQEIYYLLNSQMDYKISQKGKQQLMAKTNSTYFKCLIAKEFRWVNEVQQCLIIINFNQEIFEMSITEISFCLEVISQFPSIRDQIDKNRLHNKLVRFIGEDTKIYDLILVAGYLLQMGIMFSELINTELFERWFWNNLCFDFRVIYFIHKISQRLNYKLSQQQKVILNNYMKDAIMKLEINYFENNYLVFLLQYYPEYVNMLNIVHFTPRAYLGYLLFYKQNPQNKIQSHKIPNSVIELASIHTFRNIIEYRMTLSLDNPLSLAKSLPDFFSHSLKPVNSFLTYLKQNKIDDLEVQFYVEKAVESKLRLNNEFTQQIVEIYSINQIITLFAHLNRDRICSVNFWKKTVKMIEKLVDLIQTKTIQLKNKNQSYTNLLSIAISKNFKESTREIIYKELINLLDNSKNDWNIRSLVKISRILANSRIGEDEIWLLIQKRVIKHLGYHKQSKEPLGQALRQYLFKLILGFNSLDKGSYKFWNEMNNLLDNKAKKELLAKVKLPTSMVHTNLKITP